MTKNTDIYNGPNKPTWCPGCGNHGLFLALKQALLNLGLKSDRIMLFFGIGCSGNMCTFLKGAALHSLHGRPIPSAVAAKICNHQLPSIVIAGDGDTYGEGPNHLLAAARGNHDITVIIHNNLIYGLTTGQASPTSEKGFLSKSTPLGVIEYPINPLTLALSAGATFVSRGFAGDVDHLSEIMKRAIIHPGFSLVDVLQPCVTFNKVNTFEFYQKRVYKINPAKNLKKAFEKAFEWPQTHENAGAKKIPIGIFWQKRQKTYHQSLPQIKKKPLVDLLIDKIRVKDVFPLYS
jgi:2-oxoglutarate ferredoxin oxidoreductase subunit beta